jgi:cold shock CspA family protein
MLIPAQVTFRGLAHSGPIEADIVERVAWLEKFYDGIVSCRVLIEVPYRHRRDGRHFHVTIELTVPNGEPVIVSHEPSLHGSLKDVAAAEHTKESETESAHRHARVAVHEAFDLARRQLQDFARRQRGTIKTHEVPAHGLVTGIWSEEGYGFIEATGQQIYFNRASVLDASFDELAAGTPVAFTEEKGEKGRQASTVRMLGKHHYLAK